MRLTNGWRTWCRPRSRAVASTPPDPPFVRGGSRRVGLLRGDLRIVMDLPVHCVRGGSRRVGLLRGDLRIVMDLPVHWRKGGDRDESASFWVSPPYEGGVRGGFGRTHTARVSRCSMPFRDPGRASLPASRAASRLGRRLDLPRASRAFLRGAVLTVHFGGPAGRRRSTWLQPDGSRGPAAGRARARRAGRRSAPAGARPDGAQAVGAERPAGRRDLAEVNALDRLALVEVPEPQLVAVVIGREQAAAVGRDGEPGDFAGMAFEAVDLPAGSRGPRAGSTCRSCSRRRARHRAGSSRATAGRCARRAGGGPCRCSRPRGSRWCRPR